MKLLYNGTYLQEEDLCIPLTNRAFQYNDGFFETLIIQDGQIRFWKDHMVRIAEAARALRLKLPSELADDKGLAVKLLNLADSNNVRDYGRLKLKVWRAGAGIYTPETNAAEWLLTAQPATELKHEPIQVEICKTVCTYHSPFSHFKGPNSLIYVMAGAEKDEAGADDLLLLSSQNKISELISANIFWYFDDTLYTPALDTGCVNGIVRRNIIRWCMQNDIKVQEVLADVEHLFEADAVFAANVAGLRQLGKLQDTALSTNSAKVNTLRQALQL